MTEKSKAARRSGNCERARVSTSQRDAHSIANRAWTRAECRAMEIALGGGFAVLAVLEVIFRW